MNKNTLKSFARATRRKLIEQVTSKLDYVLTTDSAELRNKQNQIDELKKQIAETTKDDVIEKVAYTWFNRFAALRFMDTNGYTPIKVVSPAAGFTTPELLAEAKKGHIEESLRIDRTKINDLLDGRIPARDPQNEIYQMLLVAKCNGYHKIMPFMFEPINDYTELLMPDDLISQNSVVNDVVNNMTEEDCQDVEIVGWLYQYYISEKKDEVIGAKKRYTSQEIPAATQLFTPKWIVKYMVENTLGQIWLEARPNSKIRGIMEFYIEPADKDKIPPRQISSPEDLKLCDPCVGSAHILAYSFELLTKIYEEEGYDPQEIPGLILTKNLYGIEIDDRAASLASFALIMKARSYNRNFFRKPVQPNVLILQNIKFSEDELNQYINEIGANLLTTNLIEALSKFEHSKTIGSLIRPAVVSVDDILKELTTKELGGNLFLAGTHQKVLKALKQILCLQKRYDCVITNPPYMGAKWMNSLLKTFADDNYSNSKSDLCVMFIERNLDMIVNNGMISMITMHSWMFISSFKNFREKLIEEHTIQSLAHLGPRAFDSIGGEVVSTTTFVLKKTNFSDCHGSYLRLVDGTSEEAKEKSLKQAIQNPEIDYRYTANQKDFQKIPGAPIAYWASEKFRDSFEKYNSLRNFSEPRKGMVTCDNERFIRFWFEVSYSKIGFNLESREEAKNSSFKWFSYQRGGEFWKWFGLNQSIVNWEDDGFELFHMKEEGYNVGSTNHNLNYIFKSCITWNKISNSFFSARFSPLGFLYDDAGPLCFVLDSSNIKYILGFLNTKLTFEFIQLLNPTMNFSPGTLAQLPLVERETLINKELIDEIVEGCIKIAKNYWNSIEISWDFLQSELLRLKPSALIEEAFQYYFDCWQNEFFKMHKNEEGLNRIFINAYGIQNELVPDIDIKDITILQQEIRSREINKLEFDKMEIGKQYISYAAGCMFGRYSLDKDGLILANQCETVEDYLKVVPNPTFEPDEDNIIPILEDEYFTDDIVGRFKTFLKVSFGKEHYEENLKFIEDAIGKDIRSYFVRDFYKDHIKQYKKRPIYWLFSSPKRGFNALIYMHRYRPDTVSTLLNDYVREFTTKLESRRIHFNEIRLSESSSTRDRKLADKELTRIERLLKELRNYERDVLHPLAAQRIEIDLDDGVKVNYCKFGEALYPIPGLCKKK